jgi:hypothetical protein
MDRKSRKRNRSLATLSIVVIALGVAAYATRDEWAALKDQRQNATEAEARRQAAEQKYADLAEERARLETPAGQERRARELGYRKAGEETLNVR